MVEDGEEDSVHGGPVLEGAHGAGSAADFAEAALDGVGGSDGLALLESFIAEAGEELVEVVAQAGDGLGIALGPTVGEASCGMAGGDCACLALARRMGVTALTAGRAWKDVAKSLGIAVAFIR